MLECGKTSVNALGKIYGGSVAAPYSWPAHVLVSITRGSSAFYCGGTLIDLTTVMTTAQCNLKVYKK
jgi:secreted trypsin-like serine protease